MGLPSCPLRFLSAVVSFLVVFSAVLSFVFVLYRPVVCVSLRPSCPLCWIRTVLSFLSDLSRRVIFGLFSTIVSFVFVPCRLVNVVCSFCRRVLYVSSLPS